MTKPTQNQLTPIAGAADYALSDSGYVYNLKTSRRLTRTWRAGEWHSCIRNDEGRTVHVRHSFPDVRASTGLPDDAKCHPMMPDYWITPFGAVYRCGGKRYFRPRLLAEHERHGKRYVQLRSPNGKRRPYRVANLVADVWPDADLDI